MGQLRFLYLHLMHKVQLSAKEQTQEVVIALIPERLYILCCFSLSHIFVPDMFGYRPYIQAAAINMIEGIEGRGSLILGIVLQNANCIGTIPNSV